MSVYDGGSFGGVPYDQGDSAFSNQANNQATNSGLNATYAAGLADPFASQRGQYQTQLNTLTQNPGSFASSPYYQFAYDQGLNAVNRTAAAAGNLNSGNRLAALTKYGQGMAGQGYFQQANLLSNLAGVNAGSPAAAAQAYQGGVNRQQDQQSAALAAQKFAQNPNPSGTQSYGLPSGTGYTPAPTQSASDAYTYTADPGLNALNAQYAALTKGYGGTSANSNSSYDMGGYNFGVDSTGGWGGNSLNSGSISSSYYPSDMNFGLTDDAYNSGWDY